MEKSHNEDALPNGRGWLNDYAQPDAAAGWRTAPGRHSHSELSTRYPRVPVRGRGLSLFA